LKKIKYFYLEKCPYCHEAEAYLKELCSHYDEYKSIMIEKIEEQKNTDEADKHDYQYVPAFFVDDEKVHEGKVSKEICEEILKSVLR